MYNRVNHGISWCIHLDFFFINILNYTENVEFKSKVWKYFVEIQIFYVILIMKTKKLGASPNIFILRLKSYPEWRILVPWTLYRFFVYHTSYNIYACIFWAHQRFHTHGLPDISVQMVMKRSLIKSNKHYKKVKQSPFPFNLCAKSQKCLKKIQSVSKKGLQRTNTNFYV